jgi:DNA-binding beta-propeller fold protein YncE
MIFKVNTRFFRNLLLFMLPALQIGCMKDDQWVKDHLQQGSLQLATGSVFVVNEGNFMYGNATLSCYDTVKKVVQNDLFYRVNGLPLGDVAESMTIHGNSGYVVVNNSGKIYIMDIGTGKYTGKLTGLTSPRFMHFVNNQKAYVTDLYAGKITIVNPETNQITGSIPCPLHPSTEEMVQFGKLLFVTCWSVDKTVLTIDTENDQIIREVAVGDQPCGIVADKFGKIWVLCQSLPGNASKSIAQLQRIDPVSGKVEKSLAFPLDARPVKLVRDGKGENLFYLLGSEVRKMAISADQLPDKPFVSLNSKLLYGLGIDPVNGNIYVSNALDYQQSGIISRFSPSGTLLDTFKAGIIPGRFCFK